MKYSIETSGVIENFVEYEDIDELFVYHEKVENFDKSKFYRFLSLTSSGISVYKRWNNGKDYLIAHCDTVTAEAINKTPEEINGCLFSEIFPIYTKVGFLDCFREADEKDIVINFKAVTREYGKIIGIYDHTIFKDGNYIFSRIQNITKEEYNKEVQNTLFNNSNLAILELDKNFNVLRINDKIQSLLGYSLNEFNNMSLNDIIIEYKNDDSSIVSIEETIEKFANNEIGLSNSNIKLLTKSGERMWFRVNSYPIYFGDEIIQVQGRNLTDLKLAELDLYELQRDLNIIQELSSSAFITLTGLEKNFTPHLLNIIEWDKEEKYDLDLLKIIVDEDKPKFIEKANGLSYENPSMRDIVKIRTFKNNVKYLDIYVRDIFEENMDDSKEVSFYFDHILFKKPKGFVRTVCSVKDVTKDIFRERSLEKMNNFLNIKNQEVSDLLKEIHFRVKNNLQLLLSFLNLEEHYNKDSPEKILFNIKSRIQIIAFIHEMTYKSHDFININFKDFIDEEIPNLRSLFNCDDEIKIDLDIDEHIFLPIDFITYLTLITSELLTNSIKYAFPQDQKDKTIFLKVHLKDNILRVICGDNGRGLPKNFNVYNSNSLGFTIINTLIQQFEGNFEFYNSNGACFKFDFNLNKINDCCS